MQLNPSQLRHVDPVMRRAITAVVDLGLQELNKQGVTDCEVVVQFHLNPDTPTHQFKPPNTFIMVRPGQLNHDGWLTYRSGILDCIASYWSYRLHRISMRQIADLPEASQVQRVDFHPVGTVGWKALRRRLSHLEQINVPYPQPPVKWWQTLGLRK